ncbi:MAG: recombinase family protein [Clostridia bacterium]|nr:recombinase family protein [Clostridia bacterium]
MRSKVAIYPRLSEEDRYKKSEDDESESIQNQKSMLIEYALDHDWEIYDIYCDEDWGGADRNRPEFNRLLKDAEARKFDIVLCKTQSRFTRELELVEKYIHGFFPIWGIRFISIVDHADTDVKGNKKARQINGLINEWYLEDLSENIKSVFHNKVKNGQHIGSFALYGYQKDPNMKGHLIIDEEAAAIVREVFSLFVQGKGKQEIARLLNARGIPNPTEYKRRKGLRYKAADNKNSTLWRYFSISYMLTNEMYIGNMVQGKYESISYKTHQCRPLPKDKWVRVENTHEPIIDRELWNRAQDLIRQRTKAFTTGNIGLFARKARCMYCGYTLRSTKHRDGHYLTCATRYASIDACEGCNVAVRTLEKAVLEELHALNATYLDEKLLEEQADFNQQIEKQIAQCKAQIEAYEKQRSVCAAKVKTLYQDKLNGIITEDDFIEFSHEFHMEKERLNKQIDEANQQIQSLQFKQSQSESRRDLVQQYTNAEHLTREMVDILIDYIEVGRRYPKSKKRPIIIHWNF